MGCSFELGDDFEKCQYLIDEFEEILTNEKIEKVDKKSKNKNKINYEKEKEDLKLKIKEMLETINNNLEGVAQIDKLQHLNERYQTFRLIFFRLNLKDNNVKKLILYIIY